MTRLRALAVLAAALFLAGAPVSASAQIGEFNAFKDPVAGKAGAVSGPDLKAVLDKVEGGQITVSATAYVVAMFKNSGTSPVKVTGINLYPSSTVSASVNLNKCAEAPLPPEAQCAVTVAVTGLQLGAWRVEVLLDHDGRSRLATAALTGTVDSSAAKVDEVVKLDVEAVPEMLDFGGLAGGVPLVRSILLRNRTSDTVKLTGISLDAPPQSGFSFKSECPEALAPSESCVVNMTWSPLAKGLSQGVLRINHSAKSSLTKVDVTGNFSPTATSNATIYPDSVPDKGLLVADMDKIDFGSGVKGVSAITVSLINAGATDLTLKALRLAGSDNGLSIARSGCKAGLTLKPVEACALTLNWVPSREGAIIDDLQILHTGARGVLVMPIRGSADSAASRESIAVRQPGSDVQGLSSGGKAKSGEKAEDAVLDLDLEAAAVALTPVLDGYVVTSHSAGKAVINGPIGSLVVRDGEDVVISGVRWTVTIVPSGVILSSDADEILLVFDKSLRPVMTQISDSSNSSSSSSSASSSTETSTTGTASATR